MQSAITFVLANGEKLWVSAQAITSIDPQFVPPDNNTTDNLPGLIVCGDSQQIQFRSLLGDDPAALAELKEIFDSFTDTFSYLYGSGKYREREYKLINIEAYFS